MRASPDLRLTDLPFLIVGVSLGFHALIRRLHASSGLRDDVAVGMGSIFFALCENDGCIMKDLTARLKMPKGTLSGLVVRMEKMGLVERWQCPDDGRAQRVRLTRKARKLEPNLRERHQRAMSILQAGLKPGDVAELTRLLSRLLANLRTDEASGPAMKGRSPHRKPLRTLAAAR